jgi:hypothetical protein
MTRAGRQLEVRGDFPIWLGDIGGLEWDVSTITVLINEQIELVAIDVSRIGAEGCGTLYGFRASVATDAARDCNPSIELSQKVFRALLNDVGAASDGAFVFGKSVVRLSGL